MSVLVFHTMVAPHVQEAARAVHEAGQLDRFVTGVRADPTSWSQRLMHIGGRAAGLNLRREFARRSVTGVPLEKVESHPARELLRLAVARVARDERANDFMWERTEYSFDRLVARRVTARHTGVYGFETSSLRTFERASELGVRIAYEVPAPDSAAVKQILEREMQRHPELRTRYEEYTRPREAARLARRRAEWQLADVVIAASKFTRDSYSKVEGGVGKVRVIPLGAPAPVAPERAVSGGSAARGALRLLWAGSFGFRKGAHYILQAWRDGALGRHARLDIYGAMLLPESLGSHLPDGIHFHGPVPRSELWAHYEESDALLFPTLCDGFGMVASEAWSRGLPVITTRQAGAADFLRPEENGLLIEAGNSAEIIAAIQWCLEHRSELHAMRPAARATAERWQWSDYRLALAAALREAGLFGT